MTRVHSLDVGDDQWVTTIWQSIGFSIASEYGLLTELW